ncbi:hypothetical protein D3C76_1358440 [compost metagenome]
MLSGTGLGDNPLGSHPLSEQNLTDSVVDLMRSGMIQILTLQVNLRPSPSLGQPLRIRQRILAPHVFSQIKAKLFLITRVIFKLVKLLTQIVQDFLQFRRDEAAPELPKVSFLLKLLVHR